MLTKNFKTTFSLIAYTSLFNVVCFTLNVISFSYAEIGYISSFITLGIQLLLLPIYFTFIGFISKKLEFKQFKPFIIFSVISGVLLILFSLIFFDLLSSEDLYIQGLVCSLLMISQLIEVFTYRKHCAFCGRYNSDFFVGNVFQSAFYKIRK